MLKRRSQAGDTLIEVLFAVTIFSLIVVSAISLMNQGTAASQRAMEITLVRQQIDGQAEALRFLQESYVAAYGAGIPPNTPADQYSKIIQKVQAAGKTEASPLSKASCPTSTPAGSFIINPVTAKSITSPPYKAATTYAKLAYDTTDIVLVNNEGMWIEGVRTSPASEAAQQNVGYIDFHIRACWIAPGVQQPMNIGTIVRLYEPRG